ncbi:hypothetical protein DTO169E5_432 [Paecilomyces variotii]|nr:hypothetical protein DTO169E5_432 [Paecilomyces variotii]
MIFTKAMKLSGRAKAGGKAIEESEQRSHPEGDNKILEATKNELLESVKDSKRGPKVTADAGKGIAGDGRGWSNGRIITLMSVDADRINTASGMFHLIWTSPISIILTLIMLLVNIGYRALSGYALLDIATVGLHDLRSRLAIIPQDPTLFRGTVRSNLDPFNEHTDLELWSALRKADLVGTDAQGQTASNEALAISSAIESPRQGSHRIHLDTPVDEEGLNFSMGQRQLMALARALVRDSRIIVCDEATSSVDFETDQKIQRTMAYGFKGKTLLCIAHRLRTIIGYDRICVMDQGRIAEMDEPLKLWEKRDGIFRSMCDRSGIKREDFLVDDQN